MRKRVVITGMGVICPVGNNLKESWKNLVLGKCGISKIDDAAFEKLPCRIAGIIKENGAKFKLENHFKKSDLRSMSLATAYALIATEEALKDAKWDSTTDEQKLNTGVAVGMGMVDLNDICITNEALSKSYNQVSPSSRELARQKTVETGMRETATAVNKLALYIYSPFFVPRIFPNMAAGQISIKYGFRGPNHSVSTACATGAHAIGDSFRFVRDGDADIMICGGTEACISPLSIAAFSRLRALSTSFNDEPKKASRPFDKNRNGFVMGEGSAILVLEEHQHAVSRNAYIYGEILGYGLSGDASHLTAPRSDGSGAVLAMQRAINDAKLQPADITYINAHATSTPLGDAIEVKAIKTVFKEHTKNMAVSSTKGAHGHLLGTAGNLEAVFTVKAIEEGILPPTINLETTDEDMDLNFVPITYQKWNTTFRVGLKNAFGFGGTNACFCIAQYNK